MSSFNCETLISAAPETVFCRTTDISRWPETISGISAVEILTEGEVGVGTRFRETRTMFGRPCTEEMEILSFDPPRSYVVGCDNHGCRYRTTIGMEQVPEGTKLSMDFEVTPLTFMAKIMSFLMKPMMKSMVKTVTRDLEDIKVAVESSVD